MWKRLFRFLRLARGPHGFRAVEHAAPPLQIVEITADDIRADLRDAVDGMDLAIDIGDWAEAATLRAWAVQLQKTIDFLVEDDDA